MPNRRYHEVQSRTTVPLFPPSLDDYVAANTPVRAIDAYVDMLDLQALGVISHNKPSRNPGFLSN